jgi:hypothetical protein
VFPVHQVGFLESGPYERAQFTDLINELADALAQPIKPAGGRLRIAYR